MQDASAEQAAAARKDEINAARKFVTEQGIEHVKSAFSIWTASCV